MSEVEANKRATLAFFEAMQRGDADAIAGTYSDDGRVVTMGNTLISGSRGKDEIRQFAHGILDTFPEGLAFTLLNITAEADRVAVEATASGRHVSGREYRNHYHFLLRWRDGKLLELKEFMDTEAVTDILCGGQRPPADHGDR